MFFSEGKKAAGVAVDSAKRGTSSLQKNDEVGEWQVLEARIKNYGGRGFFMIPFNSRPIRRHLAAIFLRACS